MTSYNELSEISQEFLEESNSQLCQTMPISNKKTGGPYSKENKQKRRDEVYKLYFDHGYSARKISDTMQINRNTINSDISYLYDKISENSNFLDNEILINGMLHRLEIQRSRIRDKINKTDDYSKECMTLEKLLLDVDSKIISFHQKTAESTRRMWDLTVQSINGFFKEEKKDIRYLSLFDKIAVSEKTQIKIQEIINQDRKKIRII